MQSQSKLHLASSLLALASLVSAAPCDLYKSGNTPCVAAHSTTRALYSAFNGALYQIQRGSDNSKTNVSPLSAGGVANAATQDSFCANTTCVISIIYDQSGRSNHLTQAPPGGNGYGAQPNGYDNLASAIGAPVTLNGNKAYGAFISPGTGYRNDKTSGIATADQPEGLYAIIDGTHYNDGCCFDYGNAETSNDDTGNGHMESIYFGTNTFWSKGSGNGPWIMGDLENGLFTGSDPKYNPSNPTITNRFITAVIKGNSNNNWAIRGGNAQSGALSTYFNGVRPTSGGYNPMSKEGAIILGIGADNSLGAQGTFYEGVMTSGFPSDATENNVQANIVAAKYAVAALTSGPAVKVGTKISFRATTLGYTNRYLAHSGATVNTQVVTSANTTVGKQSASWSVVTGLGNSGCVSFQSVDKPGSYIRHFNFVLQLNANDGSKQFAEDATFCPQVALNSVGTNAIRSWSYPTRFIRHYANVGYIASEGGPEVFDSTTSFNDDVSWVIGASFA